MPMKIPRFFEGLTQKEYLLARKSLELSVGYFNDDEILVDEGKRTNTFWLVVSGALQGARCYPDGSRDLVQLYTAGDAVCLDVVCTRSRRSLLQISSIGMSEVIAIDYDALVAYAPPNTRVRPSKTVHMKIMDNIVRTLADDSIRKQYKVDVLYKRHLRARIETFFQHMREKTGNMAFDIGMDREQFAQYLGVNRSALSHELSMMREEGMIEFKKGHFEILESPRA
jgi:CRP-like cAMP-binding protein